MFIRKSITFLNRSDAIWSDTFNCSFSLTKLISVLQVTIAKALGTMNMMARYAQGVITVSRVQLLLHSFPVQVSNITKHTYMYAINCDFFTVVKKMRQF